MVVNKPGVDEGSLEYRIRKRIEQLVVRHADRVLWDECGGLVSDEYFETTYPAVDSEKFVRLPPIGFVSESFETAPTESPTDPTITYAGRFYESLEPYGFLEGLKRYVEKTGDRTVRFHVYGVWDSEYQEYSEHLDIGDLVEFHGWISHEELVPKLKGSDILLEVAGSDPEHENHLGSKLYDYFGSQSPILVLGDPGFKAASVVQEYELGRAVRGSDPDAVAGAIEELLAEGYTFDPNPDIYRDFSRENRIERLAEVFDELSNRDGDDI